VPSDPAPVAAVPTVVFLGDSLTAGYRLGEGQAWPALLAERFAAEGLPFRAVNAGVSGDTSAGGLARLDWVLRAEPDVVVVELGANDALRGQDLASTEANLRQILDRLQGEGAAVLLVGLEIPPNYGPAYARRFSALFPRLAEEYGVPLVPFLLDRVAAEPSLNLGDGIHPNAAGHLLVAETVAPHLRPLVAAAAAAAAEREAASGAAK
jgi:acyl-CoA thioesterase-1